MLNLPKPPETWPEHEKTLYSKAIPENYRGQRSLNPYNGSYHVVCEDNRVRGFVPYKQDNSSGIVFYRNQRVRGWVESTETVTFFFGYEEYGNPRIPFNHLSKILRYKLEQIDDIR